MNSYRARMAVGLLVPLAALAGCSSSSSSAKSTPASSSTTSAASTPSTTTSAATTKAAATSDAQAKRAATQKQLQQDLVKQSKNISSGGSNNFHLLWSHAGTGAATYSFPSSKGLAGVECSGGGHVTITWPGEKKTQQWDCSADGHMMTLVGASTSHRYLEIKASSPQTVWAVAAWSGPYSK